MLDRRSVLATAVAGTLVPSSALAVSFPGVKRGGPTEIADQLRTFMKLHASLKGTSVTTVEGLIHGLAPGELPKPLIEFHSLVEIKVTEVQPELFRSSQREATWLGPGGTADVETAFKNPYSGETVVPFGYVTPVNHYWFDRTGTYQGELPKVRSGELKHEWRFGGATLWVSESRRNRFPTRIDEEEFPRAFTGPFRDSVDILSYQALRNDVSGKDRFVPSTVHMTAVGPWPHWLLMGRAPGHVLWTGHGEKYRTMSEVPEATRAACERFYPGFVADPFNLDTARYGVAATMRRLRAAGRL